MVQRRAIAAGLAGVAALGCIMAVTQLAFGGDWSGEGEAAELLLKSHLRAHDPYSPPSNMYLWWGDTTNHRFTGSGEHIRHILQMGTIEGGEWRDPMFMGNNGVAAFRSQRFRRISESCCSTIVFPPFEWDFPVYNTHKIIGQRLRNYVANGNMLVLTGGIMEIEFINRYYFFNIEPADGNYSPGPFNMLPDVPAAMKECPRVLPQKGIAVTAVKKESLPSGTQVLWGTPRSSAVLMIKFCEAASPMDGMPPVKVLPRDCALSEKAGRPCSCGHIMYIGYNFQDPYPTRYDHVLKAAVEILNPSSKEALAAAAAASKSSPTQSLTMQRAAAAAGSGGDDEEGVEQKVAMQKEEIAHLEGSLATLENERKAVHQFTSKDKAPARTSALDQLRDKAAVLIGEIQRAEQGAQEGAQALAGGCSVALVDKKGGGDELASLVMTEGKDPKHNPIILLSLNQDLSDEKGVDSFAAVLPKLEHSKKLKETVMRVWEAVSEPHSGRISIPSEPEASLSIPGSSQELKEIGTLGLGSPYMLGSPFQRAKSSVESSSSGGWGSLRVLVADSDMPSLAAFKLELEEAGHYVVTATEGEQAITAARKRIQFDALVLSADLPIRSGSKVAEAVSPALRAPMIGLVAGGVSSKDEQVEEFHSVGVTTILHKPAPPGALLSILLQVTSPSEGLQSQDEKAGPVPTRVLVVDDHAANRLLVGKMLTKASRKAGEGDVLGGGAHIDYAVDGLEALEKCRDDKFDIIFMDCNMPKMDGWAATETIRAGACGNKLTPIVAVTANAMLGDREKCLECGMDDYLAKPVDSNALLTAIDKWTRRSSRNNTFSVPPEDAASAVLESDSPAGALAPAAGVGV